MKGPKVSVPAVLAPNPSARRWFLDSDDDGHWYLIPTDRHHAWTNWLCSHGHKPLPPYIRGIDNPCEITFLDPCEGEPGPNDGAQVVVVPR